MGWFYTITLYVLAFKMLMACPVSRTTLAYVSSCPKTLEEWRIRAESKRCSYVRQNCTSPQNFVYHCVLNNFANATMEVCAQETLIIDHRCAEFNIKAEKIVESYTEKCEGFCPFKYNSTEAYKYQMCYQVNYQANPSRQPANNTKTWSPTKIEDRCSNLYLEMFLSSLILFFSIFFGLTLLCIIKYKRMKEKLRGLEGKNRAEENGALLKNKGTDNSEIPNTAQHFVECNTRTCRDYSRFFCNTCHRRMCKTCRDIHLNVKKQHQHEVVVYQERHKELELESCDVHPKKIKDLFCNDCNLPLCSLCFATDHKSHKVIDFEEVYNEFVDVFPRKSSQNR